MKKVISAVLAGAMLATSVGVAAPALAEETAAPAASVQKSSVNAVYNQYLDVLQRYKTAQDNNFYRGQYDGPTLENMGLNPNVFFGSSARNLHYTLVDLANDGTPELFLADFNVNSSLPYWMIDLFGYENGSAKRIVNDRSLGYRSAYIITENGYLENQASGGARDSIYQYLKVKPNSATPVYSRSLEYVSWTGDEYYMNYGAFDYYNKYSISKSEFDNIRAQYPWKQNITWHPIDDYASLWSELNANSIPVFVDGVQIDFDQQPIIQEDRTLVPLRGVFEALGATVYWNNDTRSVTAYKDGTTVELAIGSSAMYVNGQPKYLDVAGQIINDRTMVPLRAISEAFGAGVYWDNDTRTVRVYSDESTIPSDPDEPDVEDPDVDTPNNPDVSDPDVDTPSNPDVDYPVIKDPDNPKEEQPSVDDQTKNVAYNAALLQLQGGYSYDAYYGFKALGDYKESEYYKMIAYWLNKSLFGGEFIYAGYWTDNWFDKYPAMTDSEIFNLLTQSEWICPWMQSPGYRSVRFNTDGTANTLMSGTNISGTENWSIQKQGVDFGYGSQTDKASRMRFIKLTDGLYFNVIAEQDLTGIINPGPTGQLYIDKNSFLGQAWLNYYTRYENSNYTNRDKAIEEDLGLF